MTHGRHGVVDGDHSRVVLLEMVVAQRLFGPLRDEKMKDIYKVMLLSACWDM